jgi:hypothetical protein
MAVFALLAWKLAIEPTALSVGAYLGLVLGLIVAYGGLALERRWSAPPWKK